MCIYVYICVWLCSFILCYFFSLSVIRVFSFFSVRLSLVCRFSFFSEIFNSIVGQYLRLSRERPGFESPLKSFFVFFSKFISLVSLFLLFCTVGGVAHMVEHSLCMRGARGSIPRISIIIMKIFPSLLFFIFLCVSPFYKKRQRQGSNLRSQREIAQQATALTTRPRCLHITYIYYSNIFI